jgi:hypothetical protein
MFFQCPNDGLSQWRLFFVDSPHTFANRLVLAADDHQQSVAGVAMCQSRDLWSSACMFMTFFFVLARCVSIRMDVDMRRVRPFNRSVRPKRRSSWPTIHSLALPARYTLRARSTSIVVLSLTRSFDERFGRRICHWRSRQRFPSKRAPFGSTDTTCSMLLPVNTALSPHSQRLHSVSMIDLRNTTGFGGYRESGFGRDGGREGAVCVRRFVVFCLLTRRVCRAPYRSVRVREAGLATTSASSGSLSSVSLVVVRSE